MKKITAAQYSAKKRWEAKNPEKTKITRYKSVAKSFVRLYATDEDMAELNKIFRER